MRVTETSSNTSGQPAPFETVHRNTKVPTPIALTLVLKVSGFSIVAFPLTMLQTPVPTEGISAFNCAVSEQMLMSSPANAESGATKRVIETSSACVGQAPLLMVQRNMVSPVSSDVTLLDGLATSAIVALPETMLHAPVPIVGRFAFNCSVESHTCKSVQAFELSGGRARLTSI